MVFDFISMLEWNSMLATPLWMNLNAVHRIRLVSVHVNRFFVEIVASRIVDMKF